MILVSALISVVVAVLVAVGAALFACREISLDGEGPILRLIHFARAWLLRRRLRGLILDIFADIAIDGAAHGTIVVRARDVALIAMGLPMNAPVASFLGEMARSFALLRQEASDVGDRLVEEGVLTFLDGARYEALAGRTIMPRRGIWGLTNAGRTLVMRRAARRSGNQQPTREIDPSCS